MTMLALSWYILKMLIVSGILCSYYYLALKDKIFHKWNRFYLLLTMILSVILPVISIQIPSSGKQGAAMKVLQSFTMQDEIVITVKEQSPLLNIDFLLILAYFTVSMILLATFLKSLLKIKSLLRKYNATRIGSIQFVNTHSKETPFSFFNTIFWNNAIDLHSATGSRIFNHEVAHITEKHSYDKIFLNIVMTLFWINPFFWLIRKELYMIHEFVADQVALKDGDTHSFAAMVLSTVYAGRQNPVTNNFFHSPIKRRLMMLKKNKNVKANYMTRLLALPLATLIFVGISCQVKSGNEEASKQDSTPVADAPSSQPDGTTNDSVSTMSYLDKKVVSLKVTTPEDKAFVDIKYDDGSAEKITLKEAKSRGFNIPPVPPPLPPPTIKTEFFPKSGNDSIKFTPPKIVKDQASNNIIFTRVEKEAIFPGGQSAWVKYIRRAIEKSLPDFTEKDFGTCVVKFVVNKDGTVSNVQATTMAGTMLAKVAVDAIRHGPNWIPARQNDRDVSAYRLQPVTLKNPKEQTF